MSKEPQGELISVQLILGMATCLIVLFHFIKGTPLLKKGIILSRLFSRVPQQHCRKGLMGYRLSQNFFDVDVQGSMFSKGVDV